MGGLIYFAILIYVIYRINSAKNKKNDRPGQPTKANTPRTRPGASVPNRQKYSSKPNEHECTAKPNVHDCTSEPNKPAARPQRDIISEKQQELKRRLTERYGSNRDERLSRYSTPQQAHSTYEDNVGSIMSRANANVAAYADNRIEEEGKAASIPVTKGHVDDCINDPDDCSLMDTVNDLIVMGYQSDLTFERDFIAEGMEMLGNISA